MKSLKFLCFAVVSVLFSCTQEVKFFDTTQDPLQVNSKVSPTPANVPVYAKDRLIIQYKPGVSAAKKATLRHRYRVLEYVSCALCPEENIELWIFGSGINIENQSISIQTGSGGPEGLILNIDNEFNFLIENEGNTGIDGSYVTSFTSQIVPGNNGVTLAVLDTGVDVNFPVFDTPFLYNAQYDAVGGESSGWDFVNNNDNCYDDFPLVHGTMVTYVINRNLKNLGIPHQIIPVKVSDHNGVASYFNILCGLNYALPRAHIVQMSLGWYDLDNTDNFVNDIFTNLIETYQEQTLVVTSAGNQFYDNDNVAHYPSNYPAENLLAIAAANEGLSNTASFSNYGRTNVDFYAPGEHIVFYDMGMSPMYISGTSYAAPHAAARAAQLMYDSGMSLTPAAMISLIDATATPISYSKLVKYRKLID
ncbi:MAG: S8 family serine peptidase [Gilvibacter sp.]